MQDAKRWLSRGKQKHTCWDESRGSSKSTKCAAGAVAKTATKRAELRYGPRQTSRNTRLRLHWLLLRVGVLLKVCLLLLLLRLLR